MGMVRALQEGRMPLHKASPRVRQVAMTMQPKDVTHFAETKHKGLPEHVDDKKPEKSEKSAMAFCLAGLGMAKQADVTAVLNNVRRSVRKVGDSRRKVLENDRKRLQTENERLKQNLQKSTMAMSSQQAAQQAAAAQMPPSPPPAQVAYGAMLTQPQGAEAPGKTAKPPQMPTVPGMPQPK